MQEIKQKIIKFIQENGPILPVQISRQFNGNTIFAGAFLSELVYNKKIKITRARIGNSPMYYISGQEEKLEALREHLPQRPKMAYDSLKQKKIMRDGVCEPWERVALREIEDFAVPLNVNLGGNSEIFWKWHLVPNEDAKKIILQMVGKKEEPKKVPKKEKPLEKKQEKLKEKKILKADKPKGEFYEQLLEYFSNNKINVLTQEVKKKNKEIHFVSEIPSSIGSLKYYIVARNKKKLNEADLALAYHEAMNSKLPVIVLASGTITKKAEKYIDEKLSGLVFKKMGG
ncbi:MAG: hypothetical protein U9Q69_05015 [Nanoarchaeota archaeon]|nr:hypothetical protein [Nanoarchaeota archaeon]